MALDPSSWVVLIGLVFLAGFVDSIAGGGGLISLPAYLAVGLPPHAALATNKFSSCLGTLSAVWRYARGGTLHIRLGLAAAVAALAGSAGGTRLALALDPAALRLVMLALVPFALAVFLLSERLRRLTPHKETLSARRSLLRFTLIGFVVGGYDGLFGPGTGTFLAMGFYLFLALDWVGASAHARLTNLASNAASLAVFLAAGQVVFPLAFVTAAAGIAGNIAGSKLALARGAAIVKPLMMGVLLLLLTRVIYDALTL